MTREMANSRPPRPTQPALPGQFSRSMRVLGRAIAETYTAGQAFVEHGPANQNMVRNDGSVPAQTIVTFLTPPGAPIRGDAPPPGRHP